MPMDILDSLSSCPCTLISQIYPHRRSNPAPLQRRARGSSKCHARARPDAVSNQHTCVLPDTLSKWERAPRGVSDRISVGVDLVLTGLQLLMGTDKLSSSTAQFKRALDPLALLHNRTHHRLSTHHPISGHLPDKMATVKGVIPSCFGPLFSFATCSTNSSRGKNTKREVRGAKATMQTNGPVATRKAALPFGPRFAQNMSTVGYGTPLAIGKERTGLYARAHTQSGTE